MKILLLASFLIVLQISCGQMGMGGDGMGGDGMGGDGMGGMFWEDANVVDPLDPGVTVHGDVGLNRWRFYNFTVPGGKGYSISVIHGKRHDIDIYIRKGGDFPSRLTNYDYRDVGVEANITMDIPSEVTDTIYVVGLFGFKGERTQYSLLMQYTNGCPQSCNNHGKCVKEKCSCNRGFAGIYCQYNSTLVTTGISYRGSLQANQWAFYVISVSGGNELSIEVTQTTGDVDLYVRYEDIPNFVNWDYADYSTTNASIFSVNITEPSLGYWYFGFYGKGVTQYSFRVAEYRKCPMKCSNHGNCVGVRCACRSGFSGLACETQTSYLDNKIAVSGYVDENYWNYYKFLPDSLKSFTITVNHSSSSNCDIYVNQNALPTTSSYLYNNISIAPVTTITVYNPLLSVWNIGIYGYSACDYSIVASINYDGSKCSGCVHGTCYDSFCFCSNGWSGLSCDRTTIILQNGVTSPSVSLSTSEWAFYSINVTDTSLISFLVHETDSMGLVEVYLAIGRNPTLFDYVKAERNTNSDYHRLSVEFDSPKSAQIFLGVYGSSYLLESETVPFVVIGYYTPF